MIQGHASAYFIIVMVIAGPAIAGENNVTLNVVPMHVEAGAGETFIISIDANPGGNAVNSMRFDLSYDPSLLEGISMEKGRFLGQDGMQTANPVSVIDGSGKVQYAETRTVGGVKNPGTVAVIKFRVKENARGEQPFTLENVAIMNDVQKQLPAEVSGGDFRVTGEVFVPLRAEIKISQELSDAMNRTGGTDKIPVKITVDSEQNLNDIVNFLNARGTEASDVKQMTGLVAAKASKQLILELSSIPFVTGITIYEEAPANGNKVSGFGVIAALASLLIIINNRRRI